MSKNQQLLPEWEQQEAIILAWPDEQTDWAPWLSEVRQCYVDLIKLITQNRTGILLLIKQTEVAGFTALAGDLSGIVLVIADYNDTWVRDYAFLTCQTPTGPRPIEYQFNGWGQKFDAAKDNQVNHRYLATLCQRELITYTLVCEGGALEIDGSGALLSTELCLTNPLRNDTHSRVQYQQDFSQQLGASSVTIFQHGHLRGDDTDGHIDTLVRFTEDNGLVIQSCLNAPDDEHFAGLNALVAECKAAFPAHQIFELPLPKVVNQAGERLPASYANYLINNQQIICPVYQQPEDEHALAVLAKAYPEHAIVALNSRPLIEQFGSIHCISMQVPINTLKHDVVALFARGITIYERN